MTQQVYGKSYGATPAENYQRFFVPSIGGPLAEDLIGVAGLQAGQRVLDVACGTGVVTRLAAKRVGAAGAVTGLDVNPGMLAVARSETPSDISIDWYEASAESMPLPNEAFDVVLCQMGLQFVPNKLAALREMRRVLDTDGRAFATVPGLKPPMFAIMTDALARHLGPKVASFADLVFSLHNADELTKLLRSAGFREIDVQAKPKTLRLPAPADFLWKYLHSTPLTEAVDQAGEVKRDALEGDICAQWQEFVVDGSMLLSSGHDDGDRAKVDPFKRFGDKPLRKKPRLCDAGTIFLFIRRGSAAGCMRMFASRSEARRRLPRDARIESPKTERLTRVDIALNDTQAKNGDWVATDVPREAPTAR
jgi:ubiquinone/menaquinone biosynthesis C-methylase UbiE